MTTILFILGSVQVIIAGILAKSCPTIIGGVMFLVGTIANMRSANKQFDCGCSVMTAIAEHCPNCNQCLHFVQGVETVEKDGMIVNCPNCRKVITLFDDDREAKVYNA